VKLAGFERVLWEQLALNGIGAVGPLHFAVLVREFVLELTRVEKRLCRPGEYTIF